MKTNSSIVGIDEVGRGCLAGPLVAAAVILNLPIVGIKDSKLLTKIQREKFSAIISEVALEFSIGWVDAAYINKHGLTQSVKAAMEMAISKIHRSYSNIIIDGNYNFLANFPNVQTVVRADNLFDCVSAASIIAKVYRDNMMSELSIKYPQYGFEKHVGYGTKQHLDNLKIYGPCPEHRMFYKPLLNFV